MDKLDDPQYRRKQIEKIKNYKTHDIRLGENRVITSSNKHFQAPRVLWQLVIRGVLSASKARKLIKKIKKWHFLLLAPPPLEVRPSTKNLPDFLENPENSGTPKNLIIKSVLDYFKNPEKPIKIWYTPKSYSPKCTRYFWKSRESYKKLVHPGVSLTKVYQIFLKTQKIL